MDNHITQNKGGNDNDTAPNFIDILAEDLDLSSESSDETSCSDDESEDESDRSEMELEFVHVRKSYNYSIHLAKQEVEVGSDFLRSFEILIKCYFVFNFAFPKELEDFFNFFYI